MSTGVIRCPNCNGSGWEITDDTEFRHREACGECGGTGQYDLASDSDFDLDNYDEQP